MDVQAYLVVVLMNGILVAEFTLEILVLLKVLCIADLFARLVGLKVILQVVRRNSILRLLLWDSIRIDSTELGLLVLLPLGIHVVSRAHHKDHIDDHVVLGIAPLTIGTVLLACEPLVDMFTRLALPLVLLHPILKS